MMQSAHPQFDQRQGGFTLLELIVAMSILAFAMALVAPRMTTSRGTMQLKSAAVMLASDLRAARAAARRSNADAVVTLDLKRRIYSATGLMPRRLPSALTISYDAQQPLAAEPDRATFRFKPDGTASGGQIRLATNTARASINIDWLTGGVWLTWR